IGRSRVCSPAVRRSPKCKSFYTRESDFCQGAHPSGSTLAVVHLMPLWPGHATEVSGYPKEYGNGQELDNYGKGDEPGQGQLIEPPHQGAAQEPAKAETRVEKAAAGGPAVSRHHLRQGGLDDGFLGPHADAP